MEKVYFVTNRQPDDAGIPSDEIKGRDYMPETNRYRLQKQVTRKKAVREKRRR